MPERVELACLVADAAFLLAPDMARAEVEYRTEFGEGLSVFVDPEQIKRALFNLMKNAVQAMRGGGVLMVRARAVKDEVLVEVVDNGPGISAEVRARLFEPFFTTREKGSGLGLAVVSQTVEENGGHLDLHSTEGEGTTVGMYLPSVDRGRSMGME